MVGAVDTGEQLAMDNEKLIKKYMNIVNDINKLEVAYSYTHLLTHPLTHLFRVHMRTILQSNCEVKQKNSRRS